MMLVDMRFFVFNMSDHIKYMRVGGRQHHGWQGQFGGEDREVADIQMYHYGWNFLQLGSEMLC